MSPRIVQVAITADRAGTEQVILDLSGPLAADGADVTVLVPRGSAALDRFADEVIACGASAERVSPLYPGDRDHRRNLQELVGLFRRLRPTLVHYHVTRAYSGFEAILAGYLARAPHRIRTDHNPIVGRPSLAQQVRLRLADAMVDRIVLVSTANLENHVTTCRRPRRLCSVIPNGIDPSSVDCDRSSEQRARIRNELSLPPDASIAVMVGVDQRKGTEDFVRAAVVTARLAPSLHHAVFGGGPLLGPLQRIATELGVGDRVHFLGRRPDLRQTLTAFDIYVQPSYYEGMSVAMLEALAAGLPMVTTRVDGVSDVLPNEEGALFIEKGDVDSLGTMIARLSHDAALRDRLSAISQERVRRVFTSEATYRSYRALYSQLGVFTGDLVHA